VTSNYTTLDETSGIGQRFSHEAAVTKRQ